MYAQLDSFVLGPPLLEAQCRNTYFQYNNRRKRHLKLDPVQHDQPWIVDDAELMRRKSRGFVLYPHRVCPADFESTGEVYGFAPSVLADLSSLQREAATHTIRTKNVVLTKGQQFLAIRMGTPIPFLPFNQGAERRLFLKLKALGFTSVNAIKDEWNLAMLDSGKPVLKYVDGETVFFKTSRAISSMVKASQVSDRRFQAMLRMRDELSSIRNLFILNLQSNNCAPAPRVQAQPRPVSGAVPSKSFNSIVPSHPEQPSHRRQRRGRTCQAIVGPGVVCGRSDCPGTNNRERCVNRPWSPQVDDVVMAIAIVAPPHRDVPLPPRPPLVDDVVLATAIVAPPHRDMPLPPRPPHIDDVAMAATAIVAPPLPILAKKKRAPPPQVPGRSSNA